MTRYHVITIGSAVQDITFSTPLAKTIRNPQPDPIVEKLMTFETGAKIRSDEVRFLFGGGAANTAVTLARLGLRVATVLCVGQDGVGEAIVRRLRAEKIDTQFIQRDRRLATGFSFVLIEKRHNEHLAFAYYGANNALRLTAKTLSKISAQWFYISSLSMPDWLPAVAAVQQASTRRGSALAWNPGATQLAAPISKLRPLLKHTNLLILNRDEATELALRLKLLPKLNHYSCPFLARALASCGPQLIVVTDGIKGAYVYNVSTQRLYFEKPKQTKPTDTTGAGDAFGATLVAGLCRWPNDLAKALHLATINATAQVTVIGAQEGLLTWTQIQKRLRRS